MTDHDTLDATDGAPLDDADDGVGAAPAAPRRPVNWWMITAVVVIVAVAAATVAGGLLTRDNAAAATVSGHRISIGDVNDFLAALRSNRAFVQAEQQQGQPVVDASGHIASSWGTTAVRVLIVGRLYDQALAQRHLNVTPRDIAQLSPDLRNAFNGFPKEFASRELHLQGAIGVLDRSLGGNGNGQRADAYVHRLAARAHISVDPRYGTVDARSPQLVVPPVTPNVRDERNGGGAPSGPPIGG